MHQAGEVVFCDEFFWNFGQLNFYIFWSSKWGAEVKNSMSKHTYLAPFIGKTLLIINLKSSSDAVFVPTSSG